jgi:cytochrome c-type biogenesis protein CcmE
LGAVEQAGGQTDVKERALADPSSPRIEVIYQGVKPDRLVDAAQPIVRGRLQPDGRFLADELLLTCPSRYQDAPGEQA